MLRVLVVEDSLTVRAHLVATLCSDPQLEVVGEASDGESAILLCEKLRPDVVTLDMMLSRGTTGTEVTEHIMAFCPTPIVIVSSSFNRGEVAPTIEALAAGAIEVIEKPDGHAAPGVWEREFIETVKLAARIKVITHPRSRLRGLPRASSARSGISTQSQSQSPAQSQSLLPSPRAGEILPKDLIAMGASTGGPGAVVEILRHAPPAPVLLVIHIGKAFAVGLAGWLARVLPMPVAEAVHGQPLPPPGKPSVIIAPPDRHLSVEGGRLCLSHGEERNACRPSVDVLFESVADQLGPRAAGCLLTGMGKDGAAGLLLMRQRGAATIAQDQSTSTVFGMPREAIRIGAAEQVLRLHEIGPALVTLSRSPPRTI